MNGDEDTPRPSRSTPPERPSAKPTPPGPPEFYTPTPKPGPRPSAPQPSPRPNAAEMVDKADAAEIALRRPGWDITSPGYVQADHAYVNRKSKKYAAWGAAAAIAFQMFTQTVPMLVDLWEKHLDRQTQRALMKPEKAAP